MSQNFNLKKIEQKAYFSYHNDGIIDILIGFVILLFGIGMATDMAYLAAISASVGVPIWLAAKKYVTYPRLGLVKFNQDRINKEKNILFLSILLGVVVLMSVSLFYLSAKFTTLTIDHTLFILWALFALIFGQVAFMTGIMRMYAYAAVTLIVFITCSLLNIYPPLYFIISGFAVLLSGMAVLINFLHKYPLPKEVE